MVVVLLGIRRREAEPEPTWAAHGVDRSETHHRGKYVRLIGVNL
jgi:hypothetical protein